MLSSWVVEAICLEPCASTFATIFEVTTYRTHICTCLCTFFNGKWVMFRTTVDLSTLLCIQIICRVEAPLTDHLRDSASNLEKYKAMQISHAWWKYGGLQFFGKCIPWIEINVNYVNQELVWTYYHCLESAMTAHFNHSFLLTLATKTRTCVMTLLVSAWLKLSPCLIKISGPYKLPMGSW